MKLKSLVGASSIPQINDAVAASKNPRIASFVVTAYVHAFQLGFKILAGIAVVQIILCLGLKKVTLTGGSKDTNCLRGDLETVDIENLDSKKREEVEVDKTGQKEEEVQKFEVETTVR